MRAAIICGTTRRNITSHLLEAYLNGLGHDVETETFRLPQDGTGFCTGCLSCFVHSGSACPDADRAAAIWKAFRRADLIIFALPVYAFHAPGAVKAVLDHFAWHWMPHRPDPAMFTKRAAILVQAAGSGMRRAARDIRDSLAWWGISDIQTVCVRSWAVSWVQMKTKRRTAAVRTAERAGRRMRHRLAHRTRTSLPVRMRFAACRFLHQHFSQPGSADRFYWEQHGWLGSGRPWRPEKN